MTKFRFRLEPVLQHRETQEELAQRELSQAISAVAAQQERAVAAAQAAEAELIKLRAIQSAVAVPLHELRAQHEGLEHARRVAAHESAGVEQLDLMANERREDLVVARQAVEALAKLKDRQRAEHVAEVDRRDAAQMDELAVRRHRAGSPVGGAAA